MRHQAPPPSCTEQSNGRIDFPAGVSTWSGNRRRVLRINYVYTKYAPSPGSPRAPEPAIWSPAVVLVESPNSENLNPPSFGVGSCKESQAAESRFVTSRDTFLLAAAEQRRCRRPTEWAIRWQGCRDVTRPANGSIEEVAKALCRRGGPAALRVIPPLN